MTDYFGYVHTGKLNQESAAAMIKYIYIFCAFSAQILSLAHTYSPCFGYYDVITLHWKLKRHSKRDFSWKGKNGFPEYLQQLCRNHLLVNMKSSVERLSMFGSTNFKTEFPMVSAKQRLLFFHIIHSKEA